MVNILSVILVFIRNLYKHIFGVKKLTTEMFIKALDFVLKHEGERSNNSADPGGLTLYGISFQSYPEIVKGMDELYQQGKKDECKKIAKEIYYRDYWIPLNCDNYDDKLALSIFDSGVNCGIGTVKLWIDEITKTGNVSVEKILFKRLRRYANICQKNSKMTIWLLNWLVRVLHVYNFTK